MSSNWEGYETRECGEHRTVGSHRAWCYDCHEWCYPNIPCKGCELPILRADRPPFTIIHGYVRDAGGGVITVVIARDTPSYPPLGAEVALIVNATTSPTNKENT